MKKILKILLIVDACVAVVFFIGYGIVEVLRIMGVLKVMPFSNNSTFDLLWNIFFSGMQITSAPLVIIFTIFCIKALIQKWK